MEMPFVPSLAKIAPRRIHRDNQLNFLDPQPALDPLLAVNRVAHIVEALVVNQPIDLVPLAKFRPVSKLVLPNPPLQIVVTPT